MINFMIIINIIWFLSIYLTGIDEIYLYFVFANFIDKTW